jgi:hypothetical protein
MFESDERSGGMSEDDPGGGIGGQGGEGRDQAETTPEIGTEDQERGQTQTPAEEEDSAS